MDKIKNPPLKKPLSGDLPAALKTQLNNEFTTIDEMWSLKVSKRIFDKNNVAQYLTAFKAASVETKNADPL